MTEETKFIISEVNKLLNKNYNLSSFETFSTQQSLQLVCDVLAYLGAMPATNIQNNVDSSILVILETLHNIKYSPSVELTPDEFRDGITLGSRKVIRPLLYWLLSNPNKVKERAYLAKYVVKIQYPEELLNDEDVRTIQAQYDALIEEFWKTYTDNVKEKKNSSEAKELQHDIAKMEDDIARLLQRTEQQKEKVNNIANKEVLLTTVRAYRNEINEQQKLEEQLEKQRTLEAQMENEIKDLKHKLAYKQAHRPTNLDPLQQVLDELQANKILLKQLPEELANVKKELDMYETIMKGPEPTSHELTNLNNELTKVKSEIKTLVERKMATGGDDSQLAPFRNQAAILANKKQEIANTVMELKNQLSEIDAEISEKEDVLMTLVGGPLLQGDNLKKYVAKLREHNVIYKEYKVQLKALTNELSILTRTLDVLKLIDPSIEQILNEKQETDSRKIEDTSETDLKAKIKKLTAEADQIRAQTAQLREELQASKVELEPLLLEHSKLKESYDEITGPVVKQLKEVNDDILMLEDQIKDHEQKWKILQQNNQRKEELLLRLSEDIINAADELNTQPTYLETLKQKLTEQEEIKKKLEQELSEVESEKASGKENLEILDRIINLLQAKKGYVPY